MSLRSWDRKIIWSIVLKAKDNKPQESCSHESSKGKWVVASIDSAYTWGGPSCFTSSSCIPWQENSGELLSARTQLQGKGLGWAGQIVRWLMVTYLLCIHLQASFHTGHLVSPCKSSQATYIIPGYGIFGHITEVLNRTGLFWLVVSDDRRLQCPVIAWACFPIFFNIHYKFLIYKWSFIAAIKTAQSVPFRAIIALLECLE